MLMRKILVLILMFWFNANWLAADEFYVVSFRHDDKDVTARISSKKDKNNQNCALIKVQTDITGLYFDCNQGFATDIECDGKGEYRLYVSPGERQIKIKKEGFIPLSYTIDIVIRELDTYIMTVTRKGTTPPDDDVKTDFVKIYSTPDVADVYLNGELKGTTPYEAIVTEGTYAYLIRKSMYYDAEGMIRVKARETKEVNAVLLPKFGNFKISSTPTEADITINGAPTGKKTPFTFEFYEAGTYNISLSKYMYQTTKQPFTLVEGKTENINITMLQDYAGITIATTPETGAAITLDNKDINKKTLYTILQLESGTHTVRVTMPLYKPVEKTFTVTAGKSETITLTMLPTFANITINANPKADIYVDGTNYANSTYTTKLNEGIHKIEIKKDKYTEQTANITVVAGEPKTYTYTLLPKQGNIAVTTIPTKAEVYLNGEKKGTSPIMLYDVLIGEHTVEAKLTGYTTATKKVSVTEKNTAEAKLILENGLSVTIETTPANADIYIDNTYLGKAPQTTSLTFGTHTVKLTGIDKYKDTEHTLEIKASGTTKYNLALNPLVTINLPEMVKITGGKFTMGSTDGESDETTHSVELSDFYMGKYEVTNAQFAEFILDYGKSTTKSTSDYPNQTMIYTYEWGFSTVDPNGVKNPSGLINSGYENHPVIYVTWYGAYEYCKWLSEKTGEKYSLPSEAQWEYAAGGGATHQKWAGTTSESELYKYANYYDKSGGSSSVTYDDGYKYTAPVGKFKANTLGLYDMSGNVWEWCMDWYDSGYYSKSVKKDPVNTTDGSFRVFRGGSWSSYAANARVASRDNGTPTVSGNDLGFRVHKTL